MPQSLARLRARVLAVHDDRNAVHQHVGDVGSVVVGVLVGGGVLYLLTRAAPSTSGRAKSKLPSVISFGSPYPWTGATYHRAARHLASTGRGANSL